MGRVIDGRDFEILRVCPRAPLVAKGCNSLKEESWAWPQRDNKFSRDLKIVKRPCTLSMALGLYPSPLLIPITVDTRQNKQTETPTFLQFDDIRNLYDKPFLWVMVKKKKKT